jgi:hypothetical protein
LKDSRNGIMQIKRTAIEYFINQDLTMKDLQVPFKVSQFKKSTMADIRAVLKSYKGLKPYRC